MCGIAGYIDFTGKTVESSNVILDMLSLQKHRGPDDSGVVACHVASQRVWEVDTREGSRFPTSADVVFGFNRLSILDLSENGHQPMIGVDGQVVLMMNGEVYSAFDYKDSLIGKGYSFRCLRIHYKNIPVAKDLLDSGGKG